MKKHGFFLFIFLLVLLSLTGCAQQAVTEAGTVPGAVKGVLPGINAPALPKEGPSVEENAEEVPAPESSGKPQEVHTHSYTAKVVPPTCTTDGYTLHTCSCGDSYKDSTTAAPGHDYQVSTVAATASAQGYTLHQCSRCGDSFKDNYTASTGQSAAESSSGTQEDCWYMGIPYLPTGQEMVERSSHYDCDAARQYGREYGVSLGLTHSDALASGPHREVTASFLGSEAFLRQGTKYLKEQMSSLVDAACRDIADSRSSPADYEFYCYAYYSAPDIRYCLGVYYQEK